MVKNFVFPIERCPSRKWSAERSAGQSWAFLSFDTKPGYVPDFSHPSEEYGTLSLEKRNGDTETT